MTPHTYPLARLAGGATLALVCLLGAAAFLYPFFLSAPALAGADAARGADAPLIFAALGPALLALLLAELGAGQLNARTVAVLGVLTALNAALRLPAGPGDAPTFFFLVILAGYVYGGRFGFLLGALSLFVSALLTGGVGPWMPFQMFAMGWMGLASGALGRLVRGRAPGSRRELALLAAWGYLWGYLFGALMNLWSWPFAPGDALHWQPGLGLPETVRRYWAFYALTSLAWDSLRALGNLALILALGRLVLKELRRFQARFHWRSEGGL
jgi:energy-coupling factor transport system substrate-specific component